MKQSINLLLSLPVKEKLKLPAVLILKIWIAVLVLLMIWWGFTMWQKNSLADESTQLTLKERAIAANLIEVSKRFSDVAGRNTEEHTKQLLRQIESKQDLVAVLDLKESVNLKGFSSFFVDFSKIAPSGLWLTQFRFDQGGRDINIEGKAVESNLVFDLINQMEQVKEFSGVPLKLIHLTSAKEKSDHGPLSFKIGGEDE